MPEDLRARNDLLVLNDADNIAVLKRPVTAGSRQTTPSGEVCIACDLGMGHKVAVRAISKGEDVLKYGFPIGFATCDIPPGGHVHLHNLASRYTAIRDWEAEHDGA